MRRRNVRRSYRRRNPGGFSRSMLTSVAGVALGAWGSTALPSMLLPNFATGYTGLAIDAAIAWFGGDFIAKYSRDLGDGFKLGGLGAVALRLFSQLSGGAIGGTALGEYMPGAQFSSPSYPTQALTPGVAGGTSLAPIGRGLASV